MHKFRGRIIKIKNPKICLYFKKIKNSKNTLFMFLNIRKSKIQKQILYSLYKKIQKELFEYVCRFPCTIAQGEKKILWVRGRKVNRQLRGRIFKIKVRNPMIILWVYQEQVMNI